MISYEDASRITANELYIGDLKNLIGKLVTICERYQRELVSLRTRTSVLEEHNELFRKVGNPAPYRGSTAWERGEKI